MMSLRNLFTSLALLTVFTQPLSAQPDPDWITSVGRVSCNTVQVASGPSGSFYTLGYYNADVTDPFIAGSDTITSPGHILMKMNADLTAAWALPIACTWSGGDHDITSDKFGNVFITGNFWDTASYGSHVITGLSDYFLVKVSPDGEFLWARSGGGAYGEEVGRAVATDDNGNVTIVCATQTDTVQIDSLILPVDYQLDAFDMVVVSYDHLGNLRWAQVVSTNSTGACHYGIDAAPDGSVAVTSGLRNKTLFFGSDTIINSNTFFNLLLLKFSDTGTPLWGTTVEGTGYSYGVDVEAGPSGNIYVAGTFAWGAALPSSGSSGSGGVLIKYNSSGNMIWDRGFISSGTCRALAVNEMENIMITGYLTGPYGVWMHGTHIPGGDSVGMADVWIALLDSTGTRIWGVCAGDESVDQPSSVCTDDEGNFYTSGNFDPSFFVIGPDTLAFPAGLLRDGYIVKFGGMLAAQENPSAEKSITLFPNPASGLCFIETTKPMNDAMLRIISSSGQEVMKEQGLCGNRLSIDAGCLPAGVYHCILHHSDGDSETARLLIQH